MENKICFKHSEAPTPGLARETEKGMKRRTFAKLGLTGTLFAGYLLEKKGHQLETFAKRFIPKEEPNDTGSQIPDEKGVATESTEALRRQIREKKDKLKSENPEIYEQLKPQLDQLENLDEGKLQEIINQMNLAKESGHHGPSLPDFVITGVFGHGLYEIVTNGHVGADPYTELGLALGLKYLYGDAETRHHIEKELIINGVLVTSILALVTLGENTGFDVRGFEERIKEKFSSEEIQREQSEILERGNQATETITNFCEILEENLGKSENTGKSFEDIVQMTYKSQMDSSKGITKIMKKIGGIARSCRDLLPSITGKNTFLEEGLEQRLQREKERVLEFFVKKELLPAAKVSYLAEQNKEESTVGNSKTEKKAFLLTWFSENDRNLIEQVQRRFNSLDQIKTTYSLGSGIMTFSAGTSPLATTVATAKLSTDSGMVEKLTGEHSVGYPEGLEFLGPTNTIIPPHEIRVQAVLEDFVRNLSGLGGFGDPPFIAMIMKFGFPGFIAQTTASIPSTFGNAIASYADFLEETYPFLSKGESFHMAQVHLQKLAPEYFKLLGANIANTLIALIQGASLIGSRAFGLLAEKLDLIKTLERKHGPSSGWRFKKGVQFDLVDMFFETVDEMRTVENPTEKTLQDYLSVLQKKTLDYFSEFIDTENGEEGSEANHEESNRTETFLDSEALIKEAEKRNYTTITKNINSLKKAVTELWICSTAPQVNGRNLAEELATLRKSLEEETDPKKRSQLIEEERKITNYRKGLENTPEGKKQRKENIKVFVEKRDTVNNLIAILKSNVNLIDDEALRKQILFFIKEAKLKVAKMELSQIGILESNIHGGSMWQRFSACADMEFLQSVLGHSRADVANVLPFQANCVPGLTPVFQEALTYIPQKFKMLYIFLLYYSLNIFSSGADNLVAAIVGLNVEPDSWPYILQASIDGGKNSRIGNMADLAGCSLEEFPLAASTCLYLIFKRFKRAFGNLGYAAFLDQFCKKTGIHLEPIGQERVEQHAALWNRDVQLEQREANLDGGVKNNRREFFQLFNFNQDKEEPSLLAKYSKQWGTAFNNAA